MVSDFFILFEIDFVFLLSNQLKMKINHLQIEIDGIYKEILRDLMEDARKPILQIANKIGISGAAIHQRLRKLEQAGVISGSKFIVDTKVLGYSTMAFIGIYLEKASSNPEVVKELKKIPEVLECHYTTGNWSILIKLICRDNEHLMQLLNKKIQPIDGVSRTETYISLEQQIERQIQLSEQNKNPSNLHLTDFILYNFRI